MRNNDKSTVKLRDTKTELAPLFVDFVGRITLLNNGDINNANKLALHIRNIDDTDFVFPAHTKFTLTFDDSLDSATLAGITLSSCDDNSNSCKQSDWQVPQKLTNNSCSWTIDNQVIILSGSYALITLSNIITKANPGFAHAIVNIDFPSGNDSDYQNQIFVARFEITPFVYNSTYGSGLLCVENLNLN